MHYCHRPRGSDGLQVSRTSCGRPRVQISMQPVVLTKNKFFIFPAIKSVTAQYMIYLYICLKSCSKTYFVISDKIFQKKGCLANATGPAAQICLQLIGTWKHRASTLDSTSIISLLFSIIQKFNDTKFQCFVPIYNNKKQDTYSQSLSSSHSHTCFIDHLIFF